MKQRTATTRRVSHSSSKTWSRGDGPMTRREIVPLAIAAKEAFAYQQDLGNIEPGLDADTWRRDQVEQIVGRAGLSHCHHSDYRPLMGHFKALAGKDDEAFRNHLTTGRASREDRDTHEERRKLAHAILQALETHQAAPVDHPKGPIRPGYLVALARQKTRRPDLTLGRDLRAGLADRLTVDQLEQLRSTLVNRIAAREGRGSTQTRNKSQRATR